MWGFLLTLADGTIAEGALFPDGCVYVHEPIAEQYGSQADMLENIVGSTLQMIGPVMAHEIAKQQLQEDYQRNVKTLDSARAQLEEHYQAVQQLMKDREVPR